VSLDVPTLDTRGEPHRQLIADIEAGPQSRTVAESDLTFGLGVTMTALFRQLIPPR
jgi:hypothetical protein